MLDMFFMFLVSVILVLLVSNVLWVSISVFMFELYILFSVEYGVLCVSLVLSIVWCVGVWFWLVVSM